MREPMIGAFLAVAITVAGSAVAVAPAACTALTMIEAQSTVIRAGDSTISVGNRQDITDCSRVVVISGPGVYLVYGVDGELKRSECRPNKVCALPQGSQALLSRLIEGLKGAPERVSGGKRMDRDVERLAGIPTGRIYSLERAATFHFAATGGGPWSLVVSPASGQAPLLQRSGSDRVLRLPPGLLQRGGKYAWILQAGGVRHSGGFDILGAQEAAEVEQDLRQAAIASPGRTRAEKLGEMVILFDHGLDYEGRLLARELGL